MVEPEYKFRQLTFSHPQNGALRQEHISYKSLLHVQTYNIKSTNNSRILVHEFTLLNRSWFALMKVHIR